VPKDVSYQAVISKATMMSSFKTSAVNEMQTMFRNSLSNKIKDMTVIADPASNETTEWMSLFTHGGRMDGDELTLV